MKLFHFYRIQDETGVSGTGPVVEGVQFTNGWCVIRWISAKSSICFYQSLEEVKAIHGHGGKTEIILHDLDPLTQKRLPEGSSRFEILLQIIEEASQINVLAEDSPKPKERIRQSIRKLKDLVQVLETSMDS